MSETNADRFRARLRAMMEERRISARALSKAAGLGETAVRDVLNTRSQSPRVETAQALAAALKVPLEELLPPDVDMPPSNVAIPAQPAVVELPTLRDIPVWGAVAGANGDGAFAIVQGEVVDYVARPAGLRHKRTCYGLYVQGESMEPALYPGDLVLVDPSRPPSINDLVVIEVASKDEHGPGVAYVKRLVRRTATHVTVRQHNPDKELQFEVVRIVRMHRVLTMADAVVG